MKRIENMNDHELAVSIDRMAEKMEMKEFTFGEFVRKTDQLKERLDEMEMRHPNDFQKWMRTQMTAGEFWPAKKD
jgi:hypothetical protein